MSEVIEICGIETNNLKNIDIALEKHSVNLIIGPSGSGKSSLAFDTVGLIGQHEMTSMFADEVVEPTYRVRSYRNMIAAVPIPQSNSNNNIRSTIGTYFGIDRSVSLVYSALLGLDDGFFVLNREENLCKNCRGLGFVHELDANRIINYDVPLENCPVKCWTRNRDFYTQIIRLYCNDEGIDPKKNFRMLTEGERQAMLYGESKKKYSVRYKRAGIYSRRTTQYYGVMSGKPMLRKFIPSKQFLADQVCESCNGEKYSPDHSRFKLHDLSIGEFMCTPLAAMGNWLDAVRLNASDSSLEFAVTQITRFARKAVELDLGHLFFHRAIPTLSGGELQRLRLVQVFNTQLSDLLIVLDEPLAGLCGADKLAVFDNVVRLSGRHTMLIVDHCDTFLKEAQVVIALGEGGGKDGGSIVDVKRYIDSQILNVDCSPSKTMKMIPVVLDSLVHDFKGVDIEIVENGLNILSGKSGVGKTTLLREYFPQYFGYYQYVSQKALVGKKNSSVATVLGILDHIVAGYAKEHGKEKRFFSKIGGRGGACPSCSGVGYIDYGGNYRIHAQIQCGECGGTGFNRKLKKYKIFGKSILDVLSMTIHEATEFYNADSKMARILSEATDIMLGHLLIGQPTSTLSGGENIRIKILKSVRSDAKVYGIDEPFKGLGLAEISNVIQFLRKLVDKRMTVIVADHIEESFGLFDRQIRLTNHGAKLVGIA